MNNFPIFVHDFFEKLLTFSLEYVIIYTTKKDNRKSKTNEAFYITRDAAVS